MERKKKKREKTIKLQRMQKETLARLNSGMGNNVL